jgi:hypothetical protein
VNETTLLERDLRAIYGAYSYLHTHDLAAVSTTSRLLRAGEMAWLAGRVRDELAELRGAVEGTHGHGGGRDDIVLEAYQALYWLMVLAVATGEEYDAVRPHEPLAAGAAEDAGEWTWPDEAGQRQQALRSGFALVGRECRRGGVAAAEPTRRDLAELRAKPYLAPYWAAHDATP